MQWFMTEGILRSPLPGYNPPPGPAQDTLRFPTSTSPHPCITPSTTACCVVTRGTRKLHFPVFRSCPAISTPLNNDVLQISVSLTPAAFLGPLQSKVLPGTAGEWGGRPAAKPSSAPARCSSLSHFPPHFSRPALLFVNL